LEHDLEGIEFLLLVAAVVAMAARRLRIPYAVGLVAAGIVLAILPLHVHLGLTKEIVFVLFLPPLIFEAAFYIRWVELKRELPVILVLVTLGVALSAGLTAVGMHYLASWGWPSAILFGALISATDPVSVIATFKEAGVHGRLRVLVEAESLLNDGTAAVAFTIALLVATGGGVTAGGVGLTLLTSVAGGILCGAIVAGALILIAGRTTDHLVELTLTTVAAYGSFLIAEQLHISGVLATMTAGLLFGNVGTLQAISAKGREAVGSFWEFAAFVVNSLIFMLIGLREAAQDFRAVLVGAAAAIALVTIGRAVAVYPCCAFFAGSKFSVPLRHQHVLFWGGLRGALALALSLGLPDEIPHREEMITVAFAVVAFSVFVQGLTVTPLLRRIGEIPRS